MSSPVLHKTKRPKKVTKKRPAAVGAAAPEPEIEIVDRPTRARPQGIGEGADGGLPNPIAHPAADPRVAARQRAQARAVRQRAVKNAGDTWRKLKRNLLTGIDATRLSARDEREIKKKVSTLYDEFDQGLSSTLKKAGEAKGDDAKAALRAAIVTVEQYAEKTLKTKALWESDDTAYGARASKLADAVLAQLKDIESESKMALRAVWPDEYPDIPWASTTQAKVSGEGATGVALVYEGIGANQKLKRILKASEDPFGQLLLANLLHTEVSEVAAPAVYDVTIDRDEIGQHVTNVLQVPADPNRTRAPQVLQADFANPQKTLFSFDVAPGADLRTLAKDLTTRAQLDAALASEEFWVALGRVSLVDRFLGIDDRLVASGEASNIGNIMLGAHPGDISVIDNYDMNTQAGIRAGNTSPEILLDALDPAHLDATAHAIVLSVGREVAFSKGGGLKDAPPVDAKLVEHFKKGVQAGIDALVSKVLDPAHAQDLQDAVATIQQRGSESGLQRDVEGLQWKGLASRAKYVRDNLREPLAP